MKSVQVIINNNDALPDIDKSTLNTSIKVEKSNEKAKRLSKKNDDDFIN